MKQQLILTKPRLLRAQFNGVSKGGEHSLCSAVGFKPRGRTQLVFALIWLCCLCIYRDSAAQDRIRIGISAISLGFLPTIIAEKKAFYAKHAIHSEHVLVPCAIATNALLSDDLDYAVCTGPGIAGAIKGLPIKLVMTTQDKLGYLLLVKANVQKLADLRGKTIGISTFGSQLYLTSTTLLRRNGMEPGKDIHLIPGGDNNARIAAMDGGKVDAAFVSSPADIFGAKRGYKVLLWSRDHVPLLQNAMVTTDKQLKTAPDKVKRTIKASIEALRFIREQPEETINIAAKWLKLDPAITRAAFENYLPCYSVDGTLPDQALQDLIQYELDRGNLKKEIPLSQVASRALLQQAQKELHLR